MTSPDTNPHLLPVSQSCHYSRLPTWRPLAWPALSDVGIPYAATALSTSLQLSEEDSLLPALQLRKLRYKEGPNSASNPSATVDLLVTSAPIEEGEAYLKEVRLVEEEERGG